MGDPRRIKKKYRKPKHPWRADRIEAEKRILREYGLKNKKEIWRAETILRNYRRQARRLLALHTEQARREEKELLKSLARLGLLKKKATLDDVLALKVNDLLDRRLQTVVYKKGLANTPKHARQLIVHGHVTVKGGKVTAPSYLVRAEEEDSIKVV
jgi:small subunit ribosomal protein S4